MPQLPTTEQLENAKKFPWQWAALILISAVCGVFSIYQLRIKKSDETCDQRVQNLMKVTAKKDSLITDWQTKYINLSNELLYKNNIIDRQQQVIDKTDSLTRKRLEKPAKQIVKANE